MKPTLLVALLLALLPACELEVGQYHPPHRSPRPPPPAQYLGAWGDACRVDSQCGSGLGCTDGSCEPRRVGIYPVSALIAPGTVDGREWDSDRALPRWVWSELDIALAYGVDGLYDFMAEQAYMGWSKPDPYGYGFLSLNGRSYDDAYTIPLVERGANQLDVFDVVWPSPVGWSSVPFTRDLAVGLELWDEDQRNDEFIGFVELDFHLLRTALHQGGVVYFDTYEATDGQLLLLGVEVVAER